jgi:hypothetical protein
MSELACYRQLRLKTSRYRSTDKRELHHTRRADENVRGLFAFDEGFEFSQFAWTILGGCQSFNERIAMLAIVEIRTGNH